MATRVERMTPEEKLRLIVRVEAGIARKRDSMNRALRIIRRARDHITEGDAIRAEAEQLGVEVAVGEVDKLLAVFLQHGELFGEVRKRTSRVKQSAPRRSSSGKIKVAPDKKGRTTGFFDIYGKVLETAVRKQGDRRSPDTLEKAYAAVYPDWETKHINVVRGSGDMAVISLVEDFAQGSKSLVRIQLAKTLARCVLYTEQGDAGFPANKPPSQKLKNLTLRLGLPERKEEIQRVLSEQWGVSVE